MDRAVLTINSRVYGAWSLRGWLLCRFAQIDFDVEVVPGSDPDSRAELLLLAPSFLVPALHHRSLLIWDTLAIAEYLHELEPGRPLYPTDPARRAMCRSVSGEVHSGFHNLVSALPMNLRARNEGFQLWSGVEADVRRIEAVWELCLGSSGGPYLFGAAPTVADAMYAPECTRFASYDVKLGAAAGRYVERILATDEMREWAAEAEQEPEESGELGLEFEF
ncbi:MAG: glutathione S-transferase [Actinomycetota bacterium]|nr:glutathione S-transferase [Actinomycetota bacterium]